MYVKTKKLTIRKLCDMMSRNYVSKKISNGRPYTNTFAKFI